MCRTISVIAASLTILPGMSGAATVTGRVEVRLAPGAAASTAVVYAEPLDRPAPPQPTAAELNQRDKTFLPGVLAVPVGSTVAFPNRDPIFHNVFSLSSPAPFDLGLYRSGASRSRTFTRPGAYRVFCNIHPQMTAFILVAPTPYVTVADAEGRYTLDLPAGRYRLTARSDRAAEASVEVTIGAGALAAPALSLDESRYVAVPHKNKFGRDYPSTAYERKGGDVER
jgi:plastocyanin